MTRTPYPGGSYVEALPSGEFAVLYAGSHLATHLGNVALDGTDYPLYHRITSVGGFQIAGEAAGSYSTLVWNGAWSHRESACGVSPVIFDNTGALFISQCGPVGSQGYRFVDESNVIWTGDETYASPVGLYEWSAYGGLMIGQGAAGGVNVWDGLVMRQLEAGDCRFIRVRGESDHVAISFRMPNSAVIWQATIAELLALPVYVPPTPTPEPPDPEPPTPEPPDPDPTPEPEPEPVPPSLRLHRKV